MELKIAGLKVDVGEGSRGGRIIGHTRSGKPIYSTANHLGHANFSPVEHNEAVKFHKKLEQRFKDAGEHDQAKKHGALADHHEAESARKMAGKPVSSTVKHPVPTVQKKTAPGEGKVTVHSIPAGGSFKDRTSKTYEGT